MPRTKTFNKEEALSTAMELFWRHGFENTSFNRLVEATGVSRYGWYKAFGDKRAIFLAALERYCEQIRQENYGRLLQPGASLPEFLGFLDDLIDKMPIFQDEKGCLASRALVDWAPNDPDVAVIVDRSWRTTEAIVLQVFVNAKHRGQLAEGVDVETAAKAFTGWLQGGGLLIRSPATLENLRAMLQTILASLGVSLSARQK